jgi:prefoldin subunit 5
MAKQRDVLKKIVALKRQSVEQQVRALQIEVERIEAAIRKLAESLKAVDDLRAGFEALRLAEEHGHARKLISDIRAGEALLVLKRRELHEAREALKRVFHSEERLGQIVPRGS